MKTMLKCRIAIPALAALAVFACTPAHPVKPLAPTYPDAIRTANAQGSVTARIRIARTGEIAFDVDADTASSGLLEASVRSTLRKARFAPARTFGVSHSSELYYVFRFVLFRPVRALRSDEQWIGAEKLSNKCPTPTLEREVIICGEAVPTTTKSVFSTLLAGSQSPMSWADSIDALEREGIRAANGRVTRVGDELRIRLRDGRMLVLKDDTAAGPTYTLPRYAGHLQAIRSHVVHVLPLEGSGNYRIINDSTGDSTVVWGMPVPSPDGTRFALTSMESEDGSDIGLIEVWKIVNDKPTNEFTYRTDNEIWDPSDAVWQDSHAIEFVRNSRTDPSKPYLRTIGRLVRTGTKWVIAGSNR